MILKPKKLLTNDEKIGFGTYHTHLFDSLHFTKIANDLEPLKYTVEAGRGHMNLNMVKVETLNEPTKTNIRDLSTLTLFSFSSL